MKTSNELQQSFTQLIFVATLILTLVASLIPQSYASAVSEISPEENIDETKWDPNLNSAVSPQPKTLAPVNKITVSILGL